MFKSDRLDEEHLERSALTASQLKKRIVQSQENVKIVSKGTNSRDVSQLFGQHIESVKDKDHVKVMKFLLEANGRWNATRRDASASDIRRIVEETKTINPQLRKELLYSWEKGFIEDERVEQHSALSPILLRKDKNRKSGKSLANLLK